MTSGARWACFLAFLALAIATLCALLPTKVSQTEITWAPAVGQANTTSLRLAAGTPAHFKAEIDCASVRAISTTPTAKTLLWTDETDFGPSGIGISGQAGTIWATLAGRNLPETTITLPSSDCGIQLDFEHRSEVISLTLTSPTAGGTAPVGPIHEASATTQEPARQHATVTGLWVDPSILGAVSTHTTTQPTRIHTPGWRWLLSGFGIAAGLASAGLLYLSSRGHMRTVTRTERQPPETTATAFMGQVKPSARWTWSDSAVTAAAAVATFIVPPYFDDGWVLATVRQFRDLGYFSNYYSVQATPQPQGFWWTWLEQLWLTPLGTPAFALRLPAMLLIIGAWWFLRRRVIDQGLAGSRLEHAAAATVYISGAAAFLITLRPEPLVAVLVAVQLGLLVRYAQCSQPWLLAAMGLNAAAALAVHQTGWTVVLATTTALPTAIRWARSNRRSNVVGLAATVGAASVATFVLLSMLGTNLTLWLDSVAAFSSESGYGSALNERDRVDLLFDSIETGAARIFFAGVSLLLILAFVTRAERSPSIKSQAGWAAVATCFGLLLTTSKLPSHIGAITPAIALLAALAISEIADADKYSRFRVGAWTLGVFACGYVATHPLFTGSRNTELLSNRDSLNSELPWAWLPVNSLLFWLVLLGGATLLAFWLAPVGLKTKLVAVLVGIAGVSTAVGVTLAPSLGEAGSTLSWVGQQNAALQGRGCGLAGSAGLKIPLTVAPMPVSMPSNSPAPLDVQLTGSTGVPADGPIAGIPTYSVRPGSSGQAQSPWFRVDGEQELAMWTRGAILGPSEIIVEARSDAGATTSTPLGSLGALNSWQALQYQPPSRTTEIRFQWNTTSGPFAVTAPVRVDSASNLVAASAGLPAWVGPDVYLQASCLQLPSIASGVLPAFQWSLGRPSLVASQPANRAREMACPGTSTSRGNRCAFAISPEMPTTYQTREVQSQR